MLVIFANSLCTTLAAKENLPASDFFCLLERFFETHPVDACPYARCSLVIYARSTKLDFILASRCERKESFFESKKCVSNMHLTVQRTEIISQCSFFVLALELKIKILRRKSWRKLYFYYFTRFYFYITKWKALSSSFRLFYY